MLVTNKKIFGRTQNCSEKKFEIFGKFFDGKNFSPNKKISAEDFFVREIFTTIRKDENLRNEDSKSLFIAKIIVCQFHERLCFFQGHSMRPQKG